MVGVPAELGKVSLPILMGVIWSLEGCVKSLMINRSFNENVQNLVRTVPADGLAPLGARPSAGTVLTKFGYRVYTEPAFQG